MDKRAIEMNESELKHKLSKLTNTELIAFRHLIVWQNIEKHHALAIKHLEIKGAWCNISTTVYHELVKRNL